VKLSRTLTIVDHERRDFHGWAMILCRTIEIGETRGDRLVVKRVSSICFLLDSGTQIVPLCGLWKL